MSKRSKKSASRTVPRAKGPFADYVADRHAVGGFLITRISGCTCGVKFDAADTDDAFAAHAANVRVLEQVASAREEAKFVAGSLLRIAPSCEDVDVVSATVVYKRGGKTFHLVVHDMTSFEESKTPMNESKTENKIERSNDVYTIEPEPGFLVIRPERDHVLSHDLDGHPRDAGPVFGVVVARNSRDEPLGTNLGTVVLHRDAVRIRIYGRKTGDDLIIVRRSDVAATITKETTKP